MKLFKVVCLVTAGFLLGGSFSFASDTTDFEANNLTQEVIDAETDHLNEAADLSQSNFVSNTNIEREIKQYLKDLGLHFGLNPGEKYIVTKVQPISENPGSANFIFSKTIAYERAYLDAQTEMLMQVFGRMSVEKAKEYFEDDSTDIEKSFEEEVSRLNSVKSQYERIFDKLETLTEAKIDKALIEEGVDPRTLNGLNQKMKQDILRDKFVKRTAKGFSAQSLLGFFVMKSFYGIDENGAPAVGIVAAKSPVTSTIARDMARQKAPSIIKFKGKHASELLPDTDNDYLPEMGVRFFFDETGRPALLSYAQSSSSYKGDNRAHKSKYMNAARAKAKLQAESQIIEFLGTVVTASETEEKGESDNIFMTNQLNDVTNIEEIVKKEVNEIVDITHRKAKSSARGDMAGITEIEKWSTTDESGTPIVGSVVIWSYDALSSAKQVQTGKRVDYNRTKKEEPAAKPAPKGVSGSKNVIRMDDF